MWCQGVEQRAMSPGEIALAAIEAEPADGVLVHRDRERNAMDEIEPRHAGPVITAGEPGLAIHHIRNTPCFLIAGALEMFHQRHLVRVLRVISDLLGVKGIFWRHLDVRPLRRPVQHMHTIQVRGNQPLQADQHRFEKIRACGGRVNQMGGGGNILPKPAVQ